MTSEILVTIPNFEKYNPRKDVKSSSWFRMENDFFLDPDIFGLNLQEKIVYIYLITQASKSNGKQFKLNISLCASVLSIKISDFEESLKKLNDINKITFTNADERARTRTCLRTDERTDVRYHADEREKEKTKLNYTPHDFEADFNAYKPPTYPVQTLSGASCREFIETVKKYPDRETWLKVLKLAFESYFVEQGRKVKISKIVNEEIFTKILNGEYTDEKTGYKSKYEKSDEEQLQEIINQAMGI